MDAGNIPWDRVSESSLDLLNWWYLQEVQQIDIQAVNFRKEVWTGDSYLGDISIKITIKIYSASIEYLLKVIHFLSSLSTLTYQSFTTTL